MIASLHERLSIVRSPHAVFRKQCPVSSAGMAMAFPARMVQLGMDCVLFPAHLPSPVRCALVRKLRPSIRTLSHAGPDQPPQPEATGQKPQTEAPGGSQQAEHAHGHSGFEAAEHQVKHRAIEKGSFKLLETVAERLTSKQMMQKIGQKVLVSGTERVAERMGEQAAGKAGMKAAERLVEHMGERVLERVAERTGERMGTSVGARVAEHAAERVAEQAAERAAERVAQHAAERAVEHAAERATERVAQHAAERAVEHAAERATERVAQHAAERAMEHAAERATERVAQHAAERAVEHAAERATERVAQHAAERAMEHAAERAAERVGTQALRKAGIRATGQAAVQVADHVADHAGMSAAQHALGSGAVMHGAVDAGGHTAAKGLPGLMDLIIHKATNNRLARRVLTPQLVARIGRGALVALPALGAVFVAHLAHQDWHRLCEEREKHNRPAAVGFAVAFICDLADVVAHVFIVLGLLHQHFHLGPHISHAVLHAAEGSGLAIAILSTAAAATAEVLAMRHTSHQLKMHAMQAAVAHAQDVVHGGHPQDDAGQQVPKSDELKPQL